jgi:hypothetical protein
MRFYCSHICLKNGPDGLEAGIPVPLDSTLEDLVFSLDNDFEMNWSRATSPDTPRATIEHDFEMDNGDKNKEMAGSNASMNEMRHERPSTPAIAVPKAEDAFPPTPSPEF